MKDRRLGLPGEAPASTAGWSTVMLNAKPRPSDTVGKPTER